MQIIGIGYRKRSGKDTFAQLLAEAITSLNPNHANGGTRVVVRSFADALKEEVCAVTGVTRIDLETNKAIFRPMLQWWGTEFRRQFSGNDNYWIGRIDSALESDKPDFAIIPDVRFKNEAAYVKSKGGILINVVRDIANDHTSGHASEVEMDGYPGWDTVVDNNLGIEDLSLIATKLAYELTR